MNKTPIFTIIALLIVIVVAFTGCEFEIDLNGSENVVTSVESVVVTDEEGSTHIETVVHEITTEAVPVVTIVEVTNEKGKVVETEKVTLSPEEVQDGKDFFNGKEEKPQSNKETTKPTEISKEPASERVTTPVKDNETIQDDFAVLNSSRFLIEGRVVTADGVSYPYKMARDGSRFAFKSVYENEELCLIMGSENVYLVSPSSKTYYKIPKDLAETEDETGEFDDLLTGDAFNLYANKKQVDTYTEKMYGVKYKVVEYDDGTMDYFNGKTLVQTVSKDGSTLYYDVISTDVSEGLFVPPADYTEEIITSEIASEFAGNLSTTACTDQNHNH